MYTCPMHLEIRQEDPGTCPKCGMNLVPEEEAKKSQTEDRGLGELTWRSYMPLIVVTGLILLVSLTLAYRDSTTGAFSLANTIEYFMIGFFLSFGAFKIMDLKGFAEGYSTYDLLAQRWKLYGYIYPFIELLFAFAMIIGFYVRPVLWAELIIMTFSGIGVVIKIAKGEKFQCACLGTFLKVPLTNITLIEDFGMAGLAAILLVIGS